MLRKLAIAIAASGAMMGASSLHALGMGDIELDSALNQPLEARIKLLKANELEDWEIKPDLASRDEFDKSGVERVFFLNSFRFEIERTEAGVFINITSDQPVVEPFLNFLVQVDWPSGRLLREYTLLLDPPVFTDHSVGSVDAPSQDSYESEQGEYESESEVALPGTSAYQDEAPVSESKQTAPAKPKTYRVNKDDTLWEVAIRTRESRKISPQQAMLAIQDLNPDAFINGNINRLKKNQVLRVPTKEEMMSRTFSEAVSEVAMQNQYVAQRKAQLDATRKEQATDRENSVADDRLKLLAGGEATTQANRGASGKVLEKAAGDQSSLENELNLALENLDKSTRDNQELRTRLDTLEEQISTLQRLINLKDEQMVALQTGMSDKEVDVDAGVAVEDVAPSKSDKKPVADLNFESSVNSEAESPAETATDATPAAMDVAKEEVKPKKKPKFVYTPPVEEEEPFDVVAFITENPQIPAALLAVLVLALVAASRARKKKEAEAEEDISTAEFQGQDPLDQVDADLDDDFHDEFEDLNLDDAEPESGHDLSDTDFDGDMEDFSSVDAGLPDSLDDHDAAEGQDVLGEVDVYMAYNRVGPAKELLEKTLMQQPGRMELRVKLLEVLSEMDDSASFDEQYEHIIQNGNDSEKAQADELKLRLVSGDESEDLGLGLDLESSDDTFGLDLDGGELDFDLDGLELASEPEATPTDAPSLELDSEASSLDFDMDLSSLDELDSEPAAKKAEASDDFDGLDFSSELGDLDLGGADDELESLDLNSSDTQDTLDVDLQQTDDSADSFDFDMGDLDEGLSTADAETDSLDLDSLESDMEVPSLADEVSLEDELAGLSSEMDAELDAFSGSLDDEAELEVASADDDMLSLDAELDGTLDEELDDTLGGDLDLPGTIDDDELADLVEIDNSSDDLDSLDASDNTDAVDDDLAGLLEDEPSTSEKDEFSTDDLVSIDDLNNEDNSPSLGDLDLDDLEEDLDFLSGTDESETKLDLARAYIDMDDVDGAKEILQEVLEEGSDEQKQKATKLMDGIA